MKFISVLFTLIGSLLYYQTFAQTDSTVENRLESILSHQFLAESVHLQFDKPNYMIGDTIYFKAEVMIGSDHQLSTLSGILYVDLVDAQNNITNSIKLQIIDGIGWGDFALLNSLHSGLYHIRAFTNYMRNQPDHFFDQGIEIRSSISKTNTPYYTPLAKQYPEIEFFPEGGQLVSGLRSKIGIKAIDRGGSALIAKGTVVDNFGITVAKININHRGIGMFYLQPEFGKNYIAKLTFSDGTEISRALPKTLQRGLVLSETDSLGNIILEIRANAGYLEEKRNHKLHLLLYSGGSASTTNILLNTSTIGFILPKNKFKTGVALACILSDSLNLISERQFFISNSSLLDIDIRSEHPTFKKGEKAQFTVNTTISSKIAVETHLSASVLNENIFSSIETGLGGSLTGRSMAINSGFDIEQTGYYLSGIKKTQADIDLLMLIKGSGFLSWNNFVRNSFKSVEYPAEQALSISGNVKGKSGLPYRNKDVFMFVINSGNLLSTKTDSQGRFQFKHLVFTDGTRFLLSTSGSANRAAGEKIILDEDELWPTGGGQSTRFTEDSVKLPGTYSRKLGNSKINEVAYVNGIIAADRRKLSSSDQNRTSNADQVIRGEEINNAPNLSSALTGMLRGVDFVRKRGVPYLQGVNEPITIIVDGTILNGAGINQLNPNSIALIELYKGANAGIYNANAGGGTLVITTKSLENGLQSNSMSSGALQIQPKGFYNPRNFKSAIYSEQQAKENGNDTSATVYWNPELVTDKNGNASFSFYTPNIAGNYRIEIEGIDKKGNSGRQVYYFKVE